MISQALFAIYDYFFPMPPTVVNMYNLILAPHRKWDTEVFLSTHNEVAIKDPNMINRNRLVKLMTLLKTRTRVQHEFIINEVQDGGQNKNMVLEHTVPPQGPLQGPPNDTTINQFIKHTNSKKLLEAIKETIQSVPQSVLVASAAITAALIQQHKVSLQ